MSKRKSDDDSGSFDWIFWLIAITWVIGGNDDVETVIESPQTPMYEHQELIDQAPIDDYTLPDDYFN